MNCSWACTPLIKLVLYVHLHKVGGNVQFAKCLGISHALPEVKLPLTSKGAGKKIWFYFSISKREESLSDEREFKHPMQNILNLPDAAEVWSVRVKSEDTNAEKDLAVFILFVLIKISWEHLIKSYVTPKTVQSKHIVNQMLQSLNHRIYNQDMPKELKQFWSFQGCLRLHLCKTFGRNTSSP